ncbi:MAG: 16S rRNA (cytosine(1402)-N(4))-methyltransferase RsmH [Paludibacteraceae bacterium]|nr:16S rRNA (cytosine(1402)-N(4))-methyltransferase RsmH [Paludibacteraceae bacterium]
MNEIYHIPAMLRETIQGLNIQPSGLYVDVTFGGGGHSRAILDPSNSLSRGEIKKLYSFDQDLDAYHNAMRSDFGNRISDNENWQFVHSNFRYLRNFMDYYGVQQIDGLLADLGVSFHHFDCPERGFSFRFSAPLDMRMNQTGGKTAADILNTYSEEDLARVLYIYGEMKNSRQLAKKIVKAREQKAIERTEELVSLVIGKTPSLPLQGGRDGQELDIPAGAKKELAKLFQALRIEVNDEMGALREMLLAAKDLLKPGGRIAILTYHSLEDRIVKNFLRSGNLDGKIEKDFYGNILSPFKVIEKGLTASDEEVERNPRARSAKLRVAEKV